MKYDDAEYCFLNFETELDNEAGGTHTGMYLAWAAQRGLLGPSFSSPDSQTQVARLLAREITGRDLYFSACDGKLTDEDLTEQGNAFTAWYYAKQFASDYERVFKHLIPDTGHATDDFCSVDDNWVNCDRLTRALDQRFAQWTAATAAPTSTGGVSSVTTDVGAASAAAASPQPPTAPAQLSLVEHPVETVAAIRQRAEAGDREAWFVLGIEYITGTRIAQDFTRAADAFAKAAELGLVDAKYNLGVCFQRGDGRPQDFRQAAHWFMQAASGGHPDATYELAMAYRKGLSVPQDLVASNALMLMAQAMGVAEAKRAGVLAGTLAESVVLVAQLRQPGQFLAILARRGAAAQSASSARASAGRDARRAAPTAASERIGFHAGHAALLIGAAAFLILLAMTTSLTGAPLKSLAVVLAVIGAYGVYRCSGDLEHRVATRWLLTGLALLPIFGSFVCILVLLWMVRRFQAR